MPLQASSGQIQAYGRLHSFGSQQIYLHFWSRAVTREFCLFSNGWPPSRWARLGHGTNGALLKFTSVVLKLCVNFKSISRNGIGDTLWKHHMTGQNNLWAVKAPIRGTLYGSFRIRPPGYYACQ